MKNVLKCDAVRVLHRTVASKGGRESGGDGDMFSLKGHQ